MAEENQKDLDEEGNFLHLNIFNYVVHYARVYNYNSETYKWRRVIPIKQVFNSWIVVPLFSQKPKSDKMENYFLIEELSDENKKVYVDLSRQEKILIHPKNFKKEPIKDAGTVIKIKKSTIKQIQIEQNKYLYDDLSVVKQQEKFKIQDKETKWIKEEEFELE